MVANFLKSKNDLKSEKIRKNACWEENGSKKPF